MPLKEKSTKTSVDALQGENTQGGNGVHGISDGGPGVLAVSNSGRGLEASSASNYGIRASSAKLAGLRASSEEGRGLEGWSIDHEGVVGTSKTGVGVYGTGTGVAGVVGDSQTGAGIVGVSVSGRGLEGRSTNKEGVAGIGKTGGFFEGSFEGVHAVSHDPRAAGVAGYNDKTGPGIFGKSTGGGPAAYFDGDVTITGVIHMNRADYAEEFAVSNSENVQPGMVMVLDDTGGVRVSEEPYDIRVAGIVSGAGNYLPAVVLDHRDNTPDRRPLALMGKAYCLVDGTEVPVGIGDLLTTSSVPGYAMKALDPVKAFGAVIGKALQPIAGCRGLIPVLVRLH